MSLRGAKRSLWLPEWLQSSLENPLLGVDPQRPVLGHPIYWLCQLGGWGSLFMLMGIAFLNEPLRRAHVVPMVNQCVFCASGLIFTHTFRALYHLRNWKDLRGATFVPKVVLSCLTFAFVETIAEDHFYYRLQQLCRPRIRGKRAGLSVKADRTGSVS